MASIETLCSPSNQPRVPTESASHRILQSKAITFPQMGSLSEDEHIVIIGKFCIRIRRRSDQIAAGGGVVGSCIAYQLQF
jgi:hypothetical protein